MRRVVVKVGSAVLTQDDSIALARMRELVDFLAELRKNNEVILVSSGAVAAGYTALKLDRGILQNKQALASIGQPILMNKYSKKFATHNILTAQVLVTAANLQRDDEIQRIKDTVNTLLSNSVIPIINENDATSTKELVVGDNDQLSAYITKYTDSDLLIILSDIDAYYDKDPRKFSDAKILKIVNSIDENELEKEASPHGAFATGGILTKLKAANYLLKHGIDMVLTSGYDLSDIKSLMLQNRHLGGTLFTKVK
ncbi:glutamate 5-kinase [Sulfurimonas sp. CVO]|jgi:glutamate 5-kinase|uniref:Glutamate 5-kinase n=1 Tax=Sulfurimonas xiamenensis TaxID=2590021 RepID=A0AAJ4A453_9BACT|nr:MULTISPECIES: glutamate 5-kinase [Sulfurimonas]PLY13289.1 MAG: glutamate 5-kinase [Sulfurimonas sp.]QFR43590.1 glutamate 5-kinase [Sulfurimonas xiamenensis]QHG90849.1 glutamate 5-kinase [Sulfurimonas sp. CVO]